ncbi:MAG: hypothetical protein J6X02_02210 [Bacilli bacterium]|nr:hypothetical protein [Bacilli bacterium]
MNEGYLEIYNQCLNKNYHHPTVEPLIDVLYALVSQYEKELLNKRDYDSHEVEYNNYYRLKFISAIIDLFGKIVLDNKQDKVLPTLSLLSKIHCNIKAEESLLYLKILFDSQKAYRENSSHYSTLFMNIFNCYLCKETYKRHGYIIAVRIDPKYYSALDSDFIKLLDIYKEYKSRLDEKNIDPEHMTHFQGYIKSIVIPHYYKDKCDVKLFPQVLDYVFNNLRQLGDFYELNFIEDDDQFDQEDALFYKIVDCSTKTIPAIK